MTSAVLWFKEFFTPNTPVTSRDQNKDIRKVRSTDQAKLLGRNPIYENPHAAAALEVLDRHLLI